MAQDSQLVAVVAWKVAPSNLPLVAGWRRLGIRAELLHPPDARRRLTKGDVALVRLDVTPTLDGVEDGIADVAALVHRGVGVLNRPAALLAAHDKWETARRLARAGIPHPRTHHHHRIEDIRELEPPFVLKPRFGSWGRDVMLCRSPKDVELCLARLDDRVWFRRQGVLLQELVGPPGRDLRLIVAADHVVGAVERRTAQGEWRTNVSLGGAAMPVHPPQDACDLGAEAARVIGTDLVSVDLLPTPEEQWVVLEVNGAVDFDAADALPGRDIYRDAAVALGLELADRVAVPAAHGI